MMFKADKSLESASAQYDVTCVSEHKPQQVQRRSASTVQTCVYSRAMCHLH